VDPSFQLVRLAAGQADVERGDFAHARAAYEAAERLSTDAEVVNSLAGMALAAARAGTPRDTRRLMERAESLATGYTPTPLHTVVALAEAYAALGQADRAIGWLERYDPTGDLHYQLHLRCDPTLEPIENDPRFRSLLVRPRPGGARGC